MQKQLSSVGWQATFFPAIRPDNAADFSSIGARGCYLSHLAVLKEAKSAGVRQLILLEDDVNFAPHFAEGWQSSMRRLEALEWSVFYPGHVLETLPQGLSLLSPSTAVRCSHFMVVNGTAIPLLIDGLETIISRPPGHPLGGPMHVDGAYNTIRMQNPSLDTYAFSPTLGYQRPSRTDVGDLKWFDRIAALRPILKFGRRIKGIAGVRGIRLIIARATGEADSGTRT